ncbi:MAG TPA: polyprenyl synthetase family protein [Thermoplasmata archaeon]
MDLTELLGYRPKLEAVLRSQYAAVRRASAPVFRPYLDDLDEFTLRGGKRFRALLVLAGYHLATGRAPDPVLPVAAALEHFQTWMLVHDDIIDHSEERRGGPSLHRLLADRHRRSGLLGDADAFGLGIGITLGDLEEPFTVGAFLGCPVPAARRAAALEEYVRMTRATALGQLLDIQNGAYPVERVTESDVLLVHELKSAVYTVASPLRIGALLGGARSTLTDELRSVGVDLGIAFQLRDDVLGAGLGDGPSGKSANDLGEGKRTLLVVRAWAKTDAGGREALRTVLGVAAASASDLERALGVIKSSGSLAYSEAKIESLTRRAFRRVDRSRTLRASGKALLREIGDRLVHRAL